MYCIVYFIPSKSVDYHPRYVTQRFLFVQALIQVFSRFVQDFFKVYPNFVQGLF
eukprot:UN21360